MFKSFSKKQWIILAISIAIVLVGKIVAPIAAFSAEGNAAFAFMLGLVILLSTNTLPAGIIALLCFAGLFPLGLVGSFPEAASLLGNQLFFYLVACYAIANVMGKSPLSKRLLLALLKLGKKSIKGPITAIMVATAILSTFVSNFPAAILMTVMAKQLLTVYDNETERKQTSKSVMIGLLFGVSFGGIATPVGNSCMVLASTYLADAGYPISFAKWMAIGVPLAAVLVFVSRILLFKLLPPVEISEEKRLSYIQQVEAQIPKKLQTKEIITLIIMGVTFVCWVANFNLILVTTCCAIFLLFPGFDLLTWNDFQKETGWAMALIICGLSAVVTVMQKFGVLSTIVEFLTNILAQSPSSILIIAILGVFTAIVMVLMPNGPVLVSVLGPTIISVAVIIGVHPAVLLLGFAFFTTFCFILPTETLNLTVYDEGKNFEVKDYLKVGLPVTILCIVLTAVWLPIAGSMFI